MLFFLYGRDAQFALIITMDAARTIPIPLKNKWLNQKFVLEFFDFLHVFFKEQNVI